MFMAPSRLANSQLRSHHSFARPRARQRESKRYRPAVFASGLLRAVVASVEHPSSFEVSTAVGTAAVRSTDGFIEAKPGSSQVGVLSGTLVLSNAATRRAITIPARWGARLEAGRDRVEARVWAPARWGARLEAGRDPVEARVWAPQEFQAVMSRTDLP
jgi:hypothetical protein